MRSPASGGRKTPHPGESARGSATGPPVMVALDPLGRRGALRILWELRAGPLRFRALQAAADLSPSVLNARLRELRSARSSKRRARATA